MKSTKTLVGTKEVLHSRIWARGSRVVVETMLRREFILSEDQQGIVEMVRRIGRRLSLEVEVVDVATENVLRRVAQEERGNIRTFPTLIADSGRRFEGEMIGEKIESFLCQITNEGRKKYL